MVKSRSIMLGLMLAVTPFFGCAYPLGGPGAPPQNRPVYGPTGYIPAGQPAYGGPVAFAPAPMSTTFAPSIAPTTTAAANPGATYFNVRSGDTVGSVATLYGVTEADLRKVNDLKPGDRIAPGQLVRIPDSSTATR